MKHAALFASFLALSAAACGARPAASPTFGSTQPGAWNYEVVASDHGDELLVQASFPPGTMRDLGVLRGAEAFVRDLEVAPEEPEVGGRAWRSVSARGASFRVPECGGPRGCTVRYRFLLRDAARAFDDLEDARTFETVTIARPSLWLVHPALARAGTRLRLHVATPPGTAFATGIYPSEDGAKDTYAADASVLPAAPYTVFGAVGVRRAQGAAGAIEIAYDPAKIPLSASAVDGWVSAGAQAVGSYFGCFPVPRVMLVLVPTEGDEVMRGHALGVGGAVIVIEIGKRAVDGALARDWVLTHELVHMGFPSVDPRHHWLEEGVATYVQPIARARAGMIDETVAWRELAQGLPRALARTADDPLPGLDGSVSWNRTYWGGALFCYLADLEIRARTRGRYSFEDALRGIVAAGGNIAVEWDFGRVLDAGDRAVGVPVLRELYEKLGSAPPRVDVVGSLRTIGVVPGAAHEVTIDDRAPLAELRRAITGAVAGHGAEAPTIAACPAAPASDAKTAQRGAHDLR